MTVIARMLGLALGALGAGLWASPALAEIPCTYHAAPVEKDGGRVPAERDVRERIYHGDPLSHA